jgi:hypothetical protein
VENSRSKQLINVKYILLQYIGIIIAAINLLSCLIYTLNFIIGMYYRKKSIWVSALSMVSAATKGLRPYSQG